jgi:integrase
MLTDLAIKRIKPGPSPVKASDSGGLHLLVTPTGGRLWKCAYRFAGKQRTLSFGAYPDVSLGAARARREAAKTQLRQGIDPGAVVKAEKQAVIAATANTFSAVCTEWIDRKLVKQKRAGTTVRRAEWLLGKLSDAVGDKQLSEIEAPDLLAVLRRAEAQDNHETAARMRAVASQIFRYGIATGRCKRDPASDLRGALTSATSTPHAAVTDPAEIGELMRAIDGFQRPVKRLALKILSLTAARPGELLSAEWHEIVGDVWTIPPQKAKMRREHRVPLSRQTITVLDELRTITGNSKHLLASPRKRSRSYAPNQLNDALREIGFDHDRHVAHGFRSTFSTTANESGKWSPDVIELQLAHVERNKVRGAYNRAQHWPERVDMMQWYGGPVERCGKTVGAATLREQVGAFPGEDDIAARLVHREPPSIEHRLQGGAVLRWCAAST